MSTALVKDVVARYGRIDILVNNVAISDNKHIFDITEEEWDRVLAVTLKSQFLMGKHVGQQMATQGGGRIVNIGSTSGFTGRSRAIAYSAAKGGVANLTRAMAVQLAPHKIRVNAIVPNKIGSPVGKDEFDPSRPVPNMAKRAGRAGGSGEGRAVPGDRRLRRSSGAPTCSSTAASRRWICRSIASPPGGGASEVEVVTAGSRSAIAAPRPPPRSPFGGGKTVTRTSPALCRSSSADCSP